MHVYKSIVAAILIGLPFGPAAAAPLPVKPGEYVISTTPCADPPFAALLNYDGTGFSGPHTRRCSTETLTHSGAHYTISTTCLAAGDGSPAQSNTIVQNLTIVSPSHIIMQNNHPGSGQLDYRWCSAGSRH